MKVAIYSTHLTDFLVGLNICNTKIEFINYINPFPQSDLYIFEEHPHLREELFSFCKKHPTMILTNTNDLSILRRYYESEALDVSIMPINVNCFQAKCEQIIKKISTKFRVYEKRDIDLIELGFTGKQLQILRAIEQSGDQGIDRKSLTNTIWPNQAIVSKVLDVHISGLRKKVHKIGMEIVYSNDRRWSLRNAARANQQMSLDKVEN